MLSILQLEEKVTVTYQGPIANLINFENEREEAERDDIVFCYQGNKLHVEGNWYSIEQFRHGLQSRMRESLKRDESRILYVMWIATCLKVMLFQQSYHLVLFT